MDFSYDYNYGYGDYGTTSMDGLDSSFGMLSGATLAITVIISLAVFVVTLIAKIKLYKKFKKPGWAAVVPIYNTWVLFEMGGLPGWLSLIPGVNGICTLVAYFQIAQKLGKSTGFAVCTLIFLPICALIMGFDSSMPVNQNMNNNFQGMNNNNQNMNNQPMNNAQNMVNNQQPMMQQPVMQEQTTVNETQSNEVPASTFVPAEPVTPQPMPQESIPTVDAPQFTNLNDNNNQ